MAIYEYSCIKCGAQFEEQRPMAKANDPAMCPKCGGEGQKLISVFASSEGTTKLRVPDSPAYRGGQKAA